MVGQITIMCMKSGQGETLRYSELGTVCAELNKKLGSEDQIHIMRGFEHCTVQCSILQYLQQTRLICRLFCYLKTHSDSV